MDRRNSLRGDSPLKSPEKPLVAEQSTADLINGVSRLQFQSSPTQSRLNGEPPRWESTMSYLGADFADLEAHKHRPSTRNGPFSVSESTVLFDGHHNPVTPRRRSVSGSSMDVLLTKETEISDPDPFRQSRRAVSAPEQHEPLDYDLFYNLITQLPSTQRNVHFKGILSHYFQILQEHDLDPSTDKFIITIYNQLRSASHDHAKLHRVIDIFVDSPCTEAMKLSSFLHFKEYQSQVNIFKLWVIKRRKFSELEKSQRIWDIYTRKKFMSKWLFKYGVYTEDFEDNALIFQRVKGLMKFWDIWSANLEEKYSFEQVADLQMESKFFKRWQTKLIRPEVDSEDVYAINLMKRSLKIWRLRLLEKSYDTPQRIALQKWKNKHHDMTSMMTDAEDLEMALHAGFFFTRWKKQHQKIQSEEGDLTIIYKSHVQEKFFRHWIEKLKYKRVENDVLARRDYFLKQFVMQQFKKRFINDKKVGAFQDSSDVKLTQLMFKKWHMKLHAQEQDRLLEYKTFEQWKRRHELNACAQEYELSLKMKCWEKWCVELMKRQNSLELSTTAFETYTKVIYFKNWKSAIVQSRNDEVKADDHFVGKFLKRWLSKKNDVEDMKTNADGFYDSGSSGLTLKLFFKTWVDRLDDVKESKLVQLIPEFEQSQNEIRMKSVLQLWSGINRSLLLQEQIFKTEQLIPLYISPIFEKWLNKFDLIEQAQQQADYMNSLNLLSTGFGKFQLAHIRVGELQTMLLEHQEDQDLKIGLRFLNRWSLRLMKARRDNEVIEKFQLRWNRAHMRAILLLWQGKSMEMASKRLPTEEEYEPMDVVDDTLEIPQFIGLSPVKTEDEDDESPTKYKGGIRNGISPFLGLQTPQKAIFQSYGGMQGSRGSIPGSERIRRKKIDALKSHYSQIKYAIPSPLKSRGATPVIGNTGNGRNGGDDGGGVNGTGHRVPSTGSTKKLNFGDLQIFRKSST